MAVIVKKNSSDRKGMKVFIPSSAYSGSGADSHRKTCSLNPLNHDSKNECWRVVLGGFSGFNPCHRLNCMSNFVPPIQSVVKNGPTLQKFLVAGETLVTARRTGGTSKIHLWSRKFEHRVSLSEPLLGRDTDFPQDGSKVKAG
jgi:hypothetical protein